VQELGHDWDANNGGRLSKKMQEYTESYPALIGLMGGEDLNCEGKNWKPGCNKARYYYKGFPPKGSDVNFNRKEDFAEAVAAYVFPDEALQFVEQRYRGTEAAEYLVYDDYLETKRGRFIKGLVEGTIETR